MHEFSIAEALAGQVSRHAPADRPVRAVEVRAGPLRGIDPDALRMCWQAVTDGGPLAGAALVVDLVPWTISCDACGRTWSSDVPFVTCACGNERPQPTGGDELYLVALTVDDPEVEAGGTGGGADPAPLARAEAPA